MVKITDIFDVWYGVNLEVVNCEVVEKDIPFVSRQSVNNGVVCHVKRMIDVTPNPANTLSIAVSGSVLSTFYHDYEYYSGRDVYIAQPKIELSKEEMLYYAYIIEQNKFRYNYGRAANRTFRDIRIPSLKEIPGYLYSFSNTFSFIKSPLNSDKQILNVIDWKWFRYDEVFDIHKGFYNKKPESHSGANISFIGAIDNNNGVSEYYDIQDIEEASKSGDENNVPLSEKIFEGNCITVSNNGSVGYAFYQRNPFTCSHDVNPLYLHPKWNKVLNPYIAMFLCSLIEKERYRWTYGRKWRPKRMPSSLIKLPVDNEENPDWQFMENYIKSLPYSANL